MANYVSTHTGEQIDEAVEKVLPLVSTAEQIDETVNKTAAYSNKNILDNGFFRINQRGQSTYVNETTGVSLYTVDRWYIHYNQGTVSVQSDGITLNANKGATFSFVQKIEYQNLSDYDSKFPYRGKKCTLSALVNGTVHSVTFTFPSTVSTSFYKEVQIANGSTINVYKHTNDGMLIRITTDAGASTKVNAVKLELGDVSTLLNEIANDTFELLKCQRFAYLLPINASYTAPFAFGNASSATSARTMVQTPTEMASTPRAVFLTGAVGNLQVAQNGATHACTDISVVKNNGTNCVYLILTTTGLTTNSALTVIGFKGNVNVLLSADL